MTTDYYLQLASAGLAMPIGAHLVLHAHEHPAQVLLDGGRLGAVVVETARRFRTPLAMPVMDLTLEKAALLLACGVPAEEVDAYHFASLPLPAIPANVPLTPRMKASCAAIADVARHSDLVPMGMSIGPFSLMTKLVQDPITPVYLAGAGETAIENEEIALLESALAVAEAVIRDYLLAQIKSGARAIVVCEPAANLAYFSPIQLAADPAVFERYVMQPMQRIARLLSEFAVDLVFHDCGELTDDMLRRFATLGAAVMSLGSSRRLWEDAALVPKDTVLYGNLPTRRFCDKQLTVAEVERLAGELLSRMRAAGHPFILGSECDVLSVPGSEDEILAKVDAMMRAASRAASVVQLAEPEA